MTEDEEKELDEHLESIRAELLSALDGDEEKLKEHMDHINSVRDTTKFAASLIESGDAVMINHVREITCYLCDILRYLDMEYDPTLMTSLASMIISSSEAKADMWNRYIDVFADEVNGQIIERENPEGRMDS